MSLPWVEDPAIETAEEAKEPAEADINELCKDMFSKMATYLTGELTGEALQSTDLQVLLSFRFAWKKSLG